MQSVGAECTCACVCFWCVCVCACCLCVRVQICVQIQGWMEIQLQLLIRHAPARHVVCCWIVCGTRHMKHGLVCAREAATAFLQTRDVPTPLISPPTDQGCTSGPPHQTSYRPEVCQPPLYEPFCRPGVDKACTIGSLISSHTDQGSTSGPPC
jgi:hypothetical protein